MKKRIIATIVTACIALCAAVWAQSESVEETPAATPTAAVCATETAAAEPEPEEESVPTENEIALVPQTEEWQENQPVSEPEPELIEIPTASETQPIHEQTSAPAPTQESAPTQTAKELQLGDLVYVPGVWLGAIRRPQSLRGRHGHLRKRKQNRDHGVNTAPHEILTKQIAIELIL